MNKQKIEFIESYIKDGNGDYQWNDNHGELIRCKDCKHADYSDTYRKYQCPKNKRFVNSDWFCADGER